MSTQNDKLNFGFMFTKIDVENRTVSGFATLNNIDSHGDEVDAEGSKSAFARFRGGLREMHNATSAVGTLVDFEPLKKYVMEEDKVYDGIYVSAKVSKGSQNTWEKVLDGTYKGFSIGGKINHIGKKLDEYGNEYRVIKDYDLIELSLVDNPANPLATVMTVKKIGDSYVFNDDDARKMNIFYHEETGDVVLSADDTRDGFQNIGWVDSPENTEKIRSAIQDFQRSSDENAGENDGLTLLKNGEGDSITLNTDEGGATVATEIEKTADEAVTEEVEATEATEEVVEKAADVDETEELETEEVEKAADVSEVDDAADEPADLVEKFSTVVEQALAKAVDAAKESKDSVDTVQSSFEEAMKSFETKLADLEKNLNDTLEGLNQRVVDVESGTAVKKSADVIEDNAEEDGDENFWRGSGFLSVSDLNKG